MTLETAKSYSDVLASLKATIQEARLKASSSVNRFVLQTYWEIGKVILNQQQAEGWGTKVIERLARDLREEFPDMKGLSQRNLVYMRSFAEAIPIFPITQQLLRNCRGATIVYS